MPTGPERPTKMTVFYPLYSRHRRRLLCLWLRWTFWPLKKEAICYPGTKNGLIAIKNAFAARAPLWGAYNQTPN